MLGVEARCIVPARKKKQIYNGRGSIHQTRKGIIINGKDESIPSKLIII